VSNGEWVFNDQRGQTTRTYTEAQNRNGNIFSNIIWQFGSDALYNLITTAIDIKENTAIVSFSELFTGSKNVIKLTMDNAPVGTDYAA
jgi:hypothetical protein